MNRSESVADVIVDTIENIQLTPRVRKVILAGIVALMTLGGGACIRCACCKDKAPAHAAVAVITPSAIKKITDVPKFQTENTFWDNDPEYNRVVPGGEFPPEEYRTRLLKTPNGEEIFKDIGSLSFYRVQPGDDCDKMKEKLSVYQGYEYLKDLPLSKLKSCNIPRASFKPPMLVPIPLKEENRTLSDQQLLNYCNQAIDQILQDKNYGPNIQKIIDKAGRKELLAVMAAAAKQESGGKPIGQFEFHRWEPRHSVFSFSLFHILMKDAGLTARRKLNMTEGQMYHPRNAAKAFLGFITEKAAGAGTSPDKYFPIMDHLEEFAVFYNGAYWKKSNPAYCSNISRYYHEAFDLLARLTNEQHPDEQQPAPAKTTPGIQLPTIDIHGSASPSNSSRPPDVQAVREATSEDFSAILSYCLRQKGNTKACEINGSEYPQNDQMLHLATNGNRDLADDQVARLKSYYCERMGHMIDLQYSGKYRRPAGKNWKQTLIDRQRKLNVKCEGGC